MLGSSPHTRGALRFSIPCHEHSGIIPAYAGSTYDFDVWCWNSWDHPRIRGEHPIAAKPDNLVMGSSPHTRGARDDVVIRLMHIGIIPAYAGSTT